MEHVVAYSVGNESVQNSFLLCLSGVNLLKQVYMVRVFWGFRWRIGLEWVVIAWVKRIVVGVICWLWLPFSDEIILRVTENNLDGQVEVKRFFECRVSVVGKMIVS